MTPARSDMTFRRFGRTYHLRIESAEDLRHILDLDDAHWVAASAPIDTLHCDHVFLDLLDFDHDGRIRPFELKQAIRWAFDTLRDTAGLSTGSTNLRLEAVNPDTEDGRCILTAAEKILLRLGGDRANEITLGQVRQIKRTEEARALSEAAVVLAEATRDEQAGALIQDVISTVGGMPHPSGKTGITGVKLDEFLREARAFLEWRQRGVIDEDQGTTTVMPYGRDTPAAFAALQSMRDKLDQFFAQCEAVSLDPTFAQRFGLSPTQLDPLDLNDPAVMRNVLEQAPLATPTPQRELKLDQKINPAYAESFKKLREALLEPELGRGVTTLTRDDWTRIKRMFSAYNDWLHSKAGASVESLGSEKLQHYLDEHEANKVRSLIEQSQTTALVLDNIRLIEKLLLYQGNLIHFSNNYVSFPDLYARDRIALFDQGNLIMDGRRFNLAVHVRNRLEHAQIARTSNIHVLYVEITGPGITRYEAAVAVTSGGQGNLYVGKRGVFHDVTGHELDARIVQVIENPISLREAIVAPFKRLATAVVGRIESIAVTAEQKLDKTGGDAVTGVKGAADLPQQPRAPGGMGSMLAGGGIAVAALGSSLAFITKTLSGLTTFTILAAVGVAILAVLTPTLIMALIKLRRRDLSAILEGSGWAINSRMRLTRAQSMYFTQRPPYPAGVHRMRRRMLVTAVTILAGASGAGWAIYRYHYSPHESAIPAEEKSAQPNGAGASG